MVVVKKGGWLSNCGICPILRERQRGSLLAWAFVNLQRNMQNMQISMCKRYGTSAIQCARCHCTICQGSNYGKVTGGCTTGLQFTFTLSFIGTELNAILHHNDKSTHNTHYNAIPWSMPLFVLVNLTLGSYCMVRMRNWNLLMRYKYLYFLWSWIVKQERRSFRNLSLLLWLADLPGFTRSVFKRDHALITPESHVFSPLPGWYVAAAILFIYLFLQWFVVMQIF